jgi:hypothetical protein
LLAGRSKGLDFPVQQTSLHTRNLYSRYASNGSAGKVLNLGADWRLTDKDGKIRPDARYNIQTDDGAWIYVQTEGPTQADGRTLLRGKFEAATNGTYNWLNDVVAVGVLTRNGTEKVIIDMWQVRCLIKGMDRMMLEVAN